jgi:uncharacterized protein YcbK (DUF882 family)
MIDWDKYPNFIENEFVCRCGCGQAKMKSSFLEFLQDLRTTLGFPFIVNSGYRCPEYNAEISRTGLYGPHTYGEAVDLRVFGGHAVALVGSAIEQGFSGVGLDQTGKVKNRYVHLDTIEPGGAHPRPWIWTY